MSASVHDALDQEEWRLEEIRLVLQRDSSSVNEVRQEKTPLHRVLVDRRCSADMVKLLIYHGADPNRPLSALLPDNPTWLRISHVFLAANFCLHHRSWGINMFEITEALVEGGAKVDHPDDCSLGLAVNMNVELEVIRVLVGAGANLLRTDFTGEVPLFRALKFFDVHAFGSLLDLLQGVDLNLVRNNSGDTLLHSALRLPGCTAEFVQFLIDRGIDVHSHNLLGNTALSLALQTFPPFEIDVFDVLLRNGSIVSMQHAFGHFFTDFFLTRLKSTEVKELLLKHILIVNPYIELMDRIKDERMWSFENRCKLDLLTMFSENVGNGRNLLEFLRTYSGSQMQTNGENGFNFDLLLQTMSRKRYPVYSSVIASKFGRTLLKNKFEECHVRTAVGDRFSVRREISLNLNCVCILAKYLSETDLLNAIMAFCN